MNDARKAALQNRHAILEEEIRQELARPGADDLRIAQLKKEKLALKEQLEGVS